MRTLWLTLKSLLYTLKVRYFARQTPTYHSEPEGVLIEIQESSIVQTDIDFSTERII